MSQQLNDTVHQHEQLRDSALSTIAKLQAVITEHKRTASIWQKFLGLLRKIPEEKELILVEQKLHGIVAAGESAIAPLREKQAEAEQSKLALERTLRENEGRLSELHALADGKIIGDGRTDFTRQTHRYNFELDGQPFILLDVPGIEGNEGLIRSEIEKAVQTAHAVFYVTNQAAPPQTGDNQRKGTLEKIKEHLGAQTEVWTIFNKRITNPKRSLIGRPLTSDDENASLAGLNEKMREQLGKHYREVFTLTAFPAFIASTDHFVTNSDNANHRKKFLEDFSPEELLEKSRVRAFQQLISGQLLSDSKTKITRANFNKANEALKQVIDTLNGVQLKFSELSEKLDEEGKSYKTQLNSSFKAFEKRLESRGETLIDNFSSKVRNKMYELIESDISNDSFKIGLIDKIDTQQEQLSKKLTEAVEKEVGRFRVEAKDILDRFKSQSDDLTAIYKKLGDAKINDKFEFKINIDNGIRVSGLLSGLLGIALAPFTGGASLWVAGLSALTSLVSIGKALRSALSSDYKKSQQRKATEENLESITDKLRESLHEGMESALQEMQQKIGELEQAIEAPAKQASVMAQLLGQSTTQLKSLSSQIDKAGNMK